MSAGRRIAILIGNSEFPEEPSLSALRCPQRDVEGMAAALTAQEIGLFADPLIFINQPHHTVLRAINRVFKQAGRQDQILIYYSGHGKQDVAGGLHLATVDTEADALETTSIAVDSFRRLIDNYACKQVALILDCCFAGAVGKDFLKGGVSGQLQQVSNGRGIYVLTASTATQTAREKEGDDYSLFTKHILHGLTNGEADQDEDGLVSMDDIYEYVRARVPREAPQHPMKWALGIHGVEFVIARAVKSYSPQRLRAFREQIKSLDIYLPDDVFDQAIQVIRANQPKQDKEFLSLLEVLSENRVTVGEFVSRWLKLGLPFSVQHQRELAAQRQRELEEQRAAEAARQVDERRRQEEQQRLQAQRQRELEDQRQREEAAQRRRELEDQRRREEEAQRRHELEDQRRRAEAARLSAEQPRREEEQELEPQPLQAPTALSRPTIIIGVALAVALIGFIGWLAGLNPGGAQRSANSQRAMNTQTSPNEPAGSQKAPNTQAPQIEMVNVPGGTFMMGTPNSAKRNMDEGPQHDVSVPSFAIGKYEVTQAQWRAVMGNNPSEFQGDNRPVEKVSWYDAKEFCRKLSQMTGKEYRLPSEAEWEYACRARTTTPFAFGPSLSSAQANFDGKVPYGAAPKGVYLEETTPVGGYSPNAFGIHDMHGNVWEWVEDVHHDSYKGAPIDGSAWVTGGDPEWRIRRGGSWFNYGMLCRSASKDLHRPEWSSNDLGFRVAITAK